ncbi:putative isoprenylcysteine alpha-carbonyl methylesterase ICMEL2 [Tetrabaena socialis]|uniref:protein-S-isoprenylcysteine alpha-carbonyl methylesterase n=1 Tax=Tetrabaena socialis TaxID=47790 RepID=A0A2J8A2R0_9CHLO|nr:putative isoprenylcysteine alpha-carbonyl methylesterase ICMEL2 [Tetrabaena socialis]|eukprot:PNH06804.1 putative isoprenylcysteine alpha-carbonyl methylesterase ICMEL2 [Tetrabaena socialis]
MVVLGDLRALAGVALSTLEGSASNLRLPGLRLPGEGSDGSLLDLPVAHANHAARRVFSECLLLARLAVRLLGYLGLGWKWGVQLARLILYATLLMPGFSQMMGYYLLSSRVLRSIVYGPKPRQRLDLYLPPNMGLHTAYPVVIYVTGGAWTIGYKAWGALLARRLSDQGVLVACLDYRNFPQGDALDMLEDVNTGICWVLGRIHRFGGDPDSVTLVGQSAGGHLAGLALIKQAEQAALGQPALGASPAWSPTALRAFVGVSGAFDLRALAEHLHRRGLYKNLFERVMSLTTTNGDGNGGVGGSVGGAAGCGSAAGCGGSGSGCAARLACNGAGCPSECEGSGCGTNEGRPDPVGLAGEPRHVGSSSATSDGRPSPVGLAGEPAHVGTSHDASEGRPSPAGPAGEPAHVGTSHDASGCKGGARPAYAELSPLEVARRLPAAAAALLPYVLLVHGTADKTVPAEGSARLSEALQAAGARSSRCLLVPGKTHTAFLLEDPMRGGRDMLMDTVLGAVRGAGADGRDGDSGGVVVSGGREQREAAQQQPYHVYGTLCPGWLCDLAGWVCPF